MNEDWYITNYNNVYEKTISDLDIDISKALQEVINKKRQEDKAKAAKAAKVQAEATVETYFKPDLFKPFVNKLFPKLSEDDCRTLLQLLFDALSKKEIAISPSLETAILTFMIENQ